jgi:hypothetical protein
MAKNYELAYAEIQTTRENLDTPEPYEGANGSMPLQPARFETAKLELAEME